LPQNLKNRKDAAAKLINKDDESIASKNKSPTEGIINQK
jgi:hypothetical protein